MHKRQTGTVTQVSSYTKYGALLLKLALVAAVVVAVSQHLDMASIDKVLTWQTVQAILTIQLLLGAATTINAYRHALLIAASRAPLIPCLQAVLLSAGLNLLIPGRVAELVKATYLRQRIRIPLSNGTAAIVIERLFDVCVVAAIGLVGFVGIYVQDARPLLALLLLAIVTVILLRPLTRWGAHYFASSQRPLGRFVYQNCLHVSAILTPRKSLATLALTVASWSIHYAAIWLFFYLQPSYALSLSQAALVFGAIVFAGSIPALPGGIGMIQAAVTFALTQMGVPTAEALMLSLALHGAEILICAIATPIILLLHPTGVGDLLKRAMRSNK